MPVQKKITGSYSVRKGTSQSTSKVISPSKRSLQGERIFSVVTVFCFTFSSELMVILVVLFLVITVISRLQKYESGF